MYKYNGFNTKIMIIAQNLCTLNIFKLVNTFTIIRNTLKTTKNRTSTVTITKHATKNYRKFYEFCTCYAIDTQIIMIIVDIFYDEGKFRVYFDNRYGI